jgi:hypothetical protein
VVLEVVLRDVEHHLLSDERLAPRHAGCIAPELEVWRPPTVVPGAGAHGMMLTCCSPRGSL